MSTRTLALIAVGAFVITIGDAGAKGKKAFNPALEEEIVSTLGGRQLLTRVALPSSTMYSLQETVIERKVVTVIDVDGSVHYLMTGGMSGLFPLVPEEIALANCRGVLPVGRNVTAAGYDLDASRLELELQDESTRGVFGVRIRFGAGGASAATMDDVIEGLTRIVSLGPEWEKAEQLERAWPSLASAVLGEEQAWKAAAGSSFADRRAIGRRRLAAVESGIANREECTRLKGRSCDGLEELYALRTQAQSDLTGIDAGERAAQEQSLRDRASALAAQADAQLEIASDAARPIPDREVAAERVRTYLDQHRALLGEIRALGVDVSAELGAMARTVASLDAARADVAALEQAQRAEARLQRWRELNAEAADLRGRLEAASGTLEEREAALEQWSTSVPARQSLLDDMSADGQLPPEGASASLAAESAAIETHRAKLRSQRDAATLAELEAAFVRLEAEHGSAYGQYGLSFRTSEQPVRARTLADVLQRMLDNRRAAAALGVGAAPARIAALESELSQLRRLNPGL